MRPVLVAVALVAVGVDGWSDERSLRATQSSAREPLDVAKLLAARYPEAPAMSYIPGLAWSSALRLAQLTTDEIWKEKPRREMTPFVSGEKPAIAEPYLLTSLAAHAAFADLDALDRNPAAGALAKRAADFIVGAPPDEAVRFPRRWTDDMFMATTLLARVAAREQDERYARAVGRLLTSYAETLQRPDGLFIHALDGPHAWGRGNGFALLGLAEALTYLPADWTDRTKVLEIYRTHVRALLRHQSDDGSWRQVVDDVSSYRELTVTAMTVAATARGVRLGWLERDVMPAIERGWLAVLARVNADGTLRDVCAGTGAGPTKEYYLKRPVVNGADDRGGAVVLLAAVEMEELARARRSQTGRSGLQNLLEAELARFPGRAGVWVKHLSTGAEADVRADETFNSASVIKLPVLILAFELADQARMSLAERVTIGKEEVRGGSGVFRHHDPGLRPTLRDVLLQMVITSDNTATDIAIAKVGGVVAVNAWLETRGYANGMKLTQTTGELFKKYAALPGGPARNEKTNRDRAYWLGEMTPRATGRMLEWIHECSEDGSAPSTRSCRDMIRMLRAQQAGARRLPHFLSVPVAHKTGDFPPVLANDVGIVFARSGPIVVAFFANEIVGPYGEAEDRIGHVARLIVEYFDGPS